MKPKKSLDEKKVNVNTKAKNVVNIPNKVNNPLIKGPFKSKLKYNNLIGLSDSIEPQKKKRYKKLTSKQRRRLRKKRAKRNGYSSRFKRKDLKWRKALKRRFFFLQFLKAHFSAQRKRFSPSKQLFLFHRKVLAPVFYNVIDSNYPRRKVKKNKFFYRLLVRLQVLELFKRRGSCTNFASLI